MEESELVVKHISLMYTIFNRVDNEAIVQIPRKISFSLSLLFSSHPTERGNQKESGLASTNILGVLFLTDNVANKFWIENITRSKAMKERISLCVSYLTSMEDILTLRQEMEHFVTAPENSHDFLPDFDIELQTIQDLRSLELRIEIRHKSNWASDKVRLHRRNKFLCELLEALRRVGIERPGDTPGPDNPSYVVELRNDETMEFKKEKQEKVKERKIKQGRVTLEEALPTGLNAAQEMFPGLKKRSVLEQEQGRRPSMWSPI